MSERLDLIRGQLSEISPGSWKATFQYWTHLPNKERRGNRRCVMVGAMPWAPAVESKQAQADAAFIADAPDHVRWLVQRVEELEEQVAAAESLEAYIQEENRKANLARTRVQQIVRDVEAVKRVADRQGGAR